MSIPEKTKVDASQNDDNLQSDVAEEPAVRAARMGRARNYFLTLARRAEAKPQDAEILAGMLANCVAEYWEPAFEAAMQAAEQLEYAHVHPVIDSIIAKSLRGKPNPLLIAQLYNRIPPDTLLLKQASCEIFRQTFSAMETCDWRNRNPTSYLTSLFNLFGRLVQLAEWEEADRLAGKALELSRLRYSEDPREFLEALTASIEATALVFSARGEHQRCREAREEAIRLLQNIDGHERTLAEILINYTLTLKVLGNDAAALTHSQEAVRLYRGLVEKGRPNIARHNPDSLQAWRNMPLPQLAKALMNLSSCQCRAKLHHEGLASAKEAFDILFTLSEEFPDQFREALGHARHHLGVAKMGAGDKQGGLQEFQAATGLFENLAHLNLRVYGPTYAGMLVNLVVECVNRDRKMEALARAEECVKIYRSINETAAGRYSKQLMNCLGMLKVLYGDLGHSEKAAEIAAEIAQMGEVP